MTFELLPGAIWIAVMVGVAIAVGLLALLAVVVDFFVTHHAIRIERHETFGHYYGHLALGH